MASFGSLDEGASDPRSEPTTPPSRRANQVVGRYALYDEIASGGMATVVVGRLRGDAGFSQTVAIKRLLPSFAQDPDFVRRFTEEAKLAARVRHPNVVATLDVIREAGEFFLVMEYVPGVALSELARQLHAEGTRFPPDVACALVQDALAGLHAAHSAKAEDGSPLGIVHRDVSPHNLIVGADGVLRVLDFGIAKATAYAQPTRDGRVRGKLAYMAPEQVSDAQPSAATDVYAVGVILWELLAGTRMFGDATEAVIVGKLLAGSIEDLSNHAPATSVVLLNVVGRALSRDPALRFESAATFAQALEAAQPRAPAREVAAWVHELAAIELGRRQGLVEDAERDGAVSVRRPKGHALAAPSEAPAPRSRSAARAMPRPTPTAVPTSTLTLAAEPKPSGLRRGLIGAAVVFGVAFALLSVVWVGAQRGHVAAALRADGLAGLRSLAEDVDTLPRSSAAPAPAPTESAQTPPLPSADDSVSAPVLAPPTPFKPGAAKSGANCDPPYTIDADGIQRVKRECF